MTLRVTLIFKSISVWVKALNSRVCSAFENTFVLNFQDRNNFSTRADPSASKIHHDDVELEIYKRMLVSFQMSILLITVSETLIVFTVVKVTIFFQS